MNNVKAMSDAELLNALERAHYNYYHLAGRLCNGEMWRSGHDKELDAAYSDYENLVEEADARGLIEWV